VAGGFGDGARLMKASYELVRQNPGLLWFPVISICCLAISALFWVFEGTWLYAVKGPWFLYPPLFAVALYFLSFVGVFFNVALAGAAARSLDGRLETGGLGALRAVFVLPGLLFYFDGKLLFEGHVHSPSAKVLLAFVLLGGVAIGVAVGVVRQVFAVELYRAATTEVSLAAA
jgi:hypothetical protein